MNSKFDNTNIWIDGNKYKNKDIINEGIDRYFEDYDDNFSKLKRVGIVLVKNNLNIFIPKNCKPGDDKLIYINALIKSINKNKLKFSANDSNKFYESDLFKTVEWLIKDYKINGLIKIERKEENNKRGVISWNKTINKKLPYLINDNLYILETIKNKYKFGNDFLTIIHSWIMSDLSNKYGNFFNNFKHNYKFKIKIKNKKHYIKLLRTILKTKFSNRDKKLIKTMICYLGFSEDTDFSIVTNEFHIVFEEALKVFTGHDNNLMNNVPNAIWSFKLPGERSYQIHRNNQIPDSLVNNNGKLDIYDAKYYDLSEFEKNYVINSKKRTPLDWYSVGKQYFYAISYNYCDLKKGDNYFVFPFESDHLEKKEIGDVKISIPEFKDEDEDEVIKIIIIDPLKLIKKVYE